MVPAAARTKEPYTLAILWHDRCAPRFPALDFRIVATDADGEVLARAERGCYRPSSFGPCVHPVGRVFCVKPEYRRGVVFLLCRNVAFTYFDDAMQRVTLRRIEDRLHPGGGVGDRQHRIIACGGERIRTMVGETRSASLGGA